MTICGSVGSSGINASADVTLIQNLINQKRITPALPALTVSGVCGADTITAIKAVQKFIKTNVNGLVTLSSPTFRYLLPFEYMGIEGAESYRFYGTSPDQLDRYFGTTQALSETRAIASEFYRAMPADLKIQVQIGDISFQDGHSMVPDHKGHRRGADVDIRPIRKDSQYIGVKWQESEYYDRDRTNFLVQTIRNHSTVHKIFFNDDKIHGVTHLYGHDNHIHVMFNL